MKACMYYLTLKKKIKLKDTISTKMSNLNQIQDYNIKISQINFLYTCMCKKEYKYIHLTKVHSVNSKLNT